jgi:methionyl-tRNA synthetase
MKPYFVTTAIPYVNAEPHIGFALELILADVLARHQRQRGRDVYFLTGTDENSLKNVRAAEALGLSTPTLVERNAAAFESLRTTLGLSFDDFIRTSADPRHSAGVEKLWNACRERGDIERRTYRGLYCVGCEQFYTDDELDDGVCPEHGTPAEVVEEDNDFFLLSRYQGQLLERLESGSLKITPSHYRNEVLALVRSGLVDFSISRSSARARGWGIPVPGDDDQVVYVWFDALGNYVTALDYAVGGDRYERFWAGEGDRVHVLGKGITRFHAVYWPAILLSAGLPLPTHIAVHGYLTVDGRKIGKSLGNAIDPRAIVGACGVDPVRYFLCRHVRTGRDGDFTLERVQRARDTELADLVGNLLRRTITLISKYSDGRIPAAAAPSPFDRLAAEVRSRVETAFDAIRPDEALDAIWTLVETANKSIVERAPWSLAKRSDETSQALLRTTLYEQSELLRLIAFHLQPFTPTTANAILDQLGCDAAYSWCDGVTWGALAPGTLVRPGSVLFPKPSTHRIG